MGDDIDYEPYFTVNYLGQPALEYRPAYESPIQQYYNGLCAEITEEQYAEIQKILKRQKREEEKQKAIKEFYELTKSLEKCYR